jgi:type II secretory pathway component PulF
MGCACNKNKKKTTEQFSNISNFLSKNWIFILISIIIIIYLLYFFILKNKIIYNN